MIIQHQQQTRERANGEARVSGSLLDENRRFRGTGGVSSGNRRQGFAPAFLDHATGRVYRSRFADGRPAPFHLLDGLPERLLDRSTDTGRVVVTGGNLESGFVRCGQFYNRNDAAKAVQVEGNR